MRGMEPGLTIGRCPSYYVRVLCDLVRGDTNHPIEAGTLLVFEFLDPAFELLFGFLLRLKPPDATPWAEGYADPYTMLALGGVAFLMDRSTPRYTGTS
jgi:hypothetical protein